MRASSLRQRALARVAGSYSTTFGPATQMAGRLEPFQASILYVL